jgi:cystathionine beta-lyase/cystathionine gamma-synthase
VDVIVAVDDFLLDTGLTKQERDEQGITDGLIRLSVGIENTDELIEDFEQALSKI